MAYRFSPEGGAATDKDDVLCRMCARGYYKSTFSAGKVSCTLKSIQYCPIGEGLQYSTEGDGTDATITTDDSACVKCKGSEGFYSPVNGT